MYIYIWKINTSVLIYLREISYQILFRSLYSSTSMKNRILDVCSFLFFDLSNNNEFIYISNVTNDRLYPEFHLGLKLDFIKFPV
jgi:hypothetical protein